MKRSIISSFSAVCAFGAVVLSGPISRADTIVTTTGTVDDFRPDSMVIQTERETAPVHYVVGRDVTYVDEAGNPVAVDVIRHGAPVSVDYVRDGDRMVVRKVIVRRRVETAPVVEEKTTRTTTTVVK